MAKPFHRHLDASAVHAKLSRLQDLLDFRGQGRRVARFHNDRIEPAGARVVQLTRVRISRCGDQRDAVGVVGVTQPDGRLESGNAGELEIEHDDVGMYAVREINSVQTVFSCDDVIAERSQIQPPDLERVRVIIDKKNLLPNHDVLPSARLNRAW